MRNRILIIGVALLLAATVAYAGGEHAKGTKMDPAAKATMLQGKLGLTDAQTQEVKAVLEDTSKRIAELRAQNLEPEAFKAEKAKIKADQDARLKAIFTAEQWTKYEEMRSKSHQGKKQ